jgi:ligand-binding SRPBCC domain-containing protein
MAECNLTFEQKITAPIERTFTFFSDAKNLERITPPWLHFQVVGMSTPTITEGTLIDYRLRIRGIPLRWQSRIESWRPNEMFVDTQTRGPYALWHHTHRFEKVGTETVMRDEIRYRMRGGWLSDLLAGSFVRRDIERIFTYRRIEIQKLFTA